ncbi:hypothetical protein H632_c3382p1 [Helicosporidium sp. ATCC 50920]|nr:hypothetical protein H632_c3382p1 [Helicosporidium sp. ATCC 50920]|eukprot:KDD72411.1 hypothetical protein H632_c3382p1 [Helicosporidium sp. ATCC 50920]
MAASAALRSAAQDLPGRAHLFVGAYARALEVIPRQLACNCGFDATGLLNTLRSRHAAGDEAGACLGLDASSGGVVDTMRACVWEPSIVKINALHAATEAACLVLSVDETVRNPRSETADASGGGMARMGGRGMGRGRGRR